MADAELPPFENADVQIVYGILCDTSLLPPAGDHWEGYCARHIVAALGIDRLREQLELMKHTVERDRESHAEIQQLFNEAEAALDAKKLELTALQRVVDMK